MNMVRRRGAACAAALFLFAGSILLAYAQDDSKQPPEKDKSGKAKAAEKSVTATKPGFGSKPVVVKKPKAVVAKKPAPAVRTAVRKPAAERTAAEKSAAEKSAADKKVPADKQVKLAEKAAPTQPPPAPGRAYPQRSQADARVWQQKRGWIADGSWPAQESWQRTRAQRWSSDHRTWAQRGGYGGFYIPQESFRVTFGNQNFFRIAGRPALQEGYPRFEHGGFAFLMVDPWPEYWAENWYEIDEVYVDYDDGYYLHNRSYPQVRIAITIAI